MLDGPLKSASRRGLRAHPLQERFVVSTHGLTGLVGPVLQDLSRLRSTQAKAARTSGQSAAVASRALREPPPHRRERLWAKPPLSLGHPVKTLSHRREAALHRALQRADSAHAFLQLLLRVPVGLARIGPAAWRR